MILSLDIAFSNCGWSIFDQQNIIDCGVIKTRKTKLKNVLTYSDDIDRSIQMGDELEAIIKKYDIKAVIGEMPGGSQSAKACKSFGLAIGTVGNVLRSLNIPCEFCTPQAVKKAVCRNLKASKTEIIDVVISKLDLKTKLKTVKTKKGMRQDRSVYVCEKWVVEGTFEHIADSIGAYWALKNSNLVRMFG